MSLFSKITNAVKKVAKAVGDIAKGFGTLIKNAGKLLWTGIKFILKALGAILSIVLCYTGVTPLVYTGYVRFVKYRNRDKPTTNLTARMKLYMAAYFPDIDLDRPTVTLNAVLPLTWGKGALTLGYDIYVRTSWGGKPPLTLGECSVMRMEELLHELVHVRQYQRFGWRFPCMYIFSFVVGGYSYDNMPMEREAVRYVDQHKATLHERMLAHCVPGLVPRLYD